MKTDEQIAKEYANRELDIIDGEYSIKSIENAVIFGLETGRELSDEKAMRFAEWTNENYIYFGTMWRKRFIQHGEVYVEFTTERLYTSKAFEDYLNGLKK